MEWRSRKMLHSLVFTWTHKDKRHPLPQTNLWSLVSKTYQTQPPSLYLVSTTYIGSFPCNLHKETPSTAYLHSKMLTAVFLTFENCQNSAHAITLLPPSLPPSLKCYASRDLFFYCYIVYVRVFFFFGGMVLSEGRDAAVPAIPVQAVKPLNSHRRIASEVRPHAHASSFPWGRSGWGCRPRWLRERQWWQWRNWRN